MEITSKKYGRSDWRKLLATRRGTVTVAVASAVVAAGILVFAMERYRHTVDANGNPETVFVASQAIPKNTPGDVIAGENLFKSTQIVGKQVSAGAIADAAALHGKVTVRDINPGEQLTASDFTTNGGLPSQLAPSERAITLTLDNEHGMLGLLNTGDHVDVYAGISMQGTGGVNEPVLRLLAADVPVLKPGSSSGSSSTIGAGGSNSSSQVTLKVPDADAGPLAYAADNGKVWLVLRPANATSTPAPSSTTIQSLLFGSKPVSSAVPSTRGGK
jgi:Flp pilus assembly protein CpaB